MVINVLDFRPDACLLTSVLKMPVQCIAIHVESELQPKGSGMQCFFSTTQDNILPGLK